MPEVTEKLLSEIVDRIVKEIDPLQIILFGSYARGQADANSDLDLLIVEGEPFGKGRSRSREIYRLYSSLAGLGIPKDILVYSRDEITEWKGSINHVIGRALREGKVLYERS